MNLVRIVSLIFLLAFSFAMNAQRDSLHVLFLGNSYTAFNNLPQLTQDFAQGAGDRLTYNSNTPGGYTIEQHLTDTTSLSLIRQGNWDVIVVQEQSQIPTIPFYRDSSMYPSLIALKDTIRKYNACGRIILYMTWGRRFGGQQCDVGSVNCSPNFIDFNHMQDSLETAYIRIANQLDMTIAPVGIAWKNFLTDTNLVLHTADNSHPNYTGSFIAASVLYQALWIVNPIISSFSGNLSVPLANYIKAKTNAAVTSSSLWNLFIDYPEVNYTYTQSQDTVRFQNLTQHTLRPIQYFWDFGDGTGSSDTNPTHIYSSAQTYNISLYAISCKGGDIMYQSIAIGTTGLDILGKRTNRFSASPNPFIDQIRIRSGTREGELNIQVFNLKGQELERLKIKGNEEINLSELPRGVYFLKVSSKEGDENQFLKIVKQ